MLVNSQKICKPSPAEEQLQSLQQQLRHLIQVEHQARSHSRQELWQKEEHALAQHLANITLELQAKEAALKLSDERLHAQHQHQRDQKLKELQKSHEKAAELQQQQVDKIQRQAREEAERKAAEERKRQEEERIRKQKEEEEARRKVQQEQEQARKRAEEEAKAAADKAAAAQKEQQQQAQAQQQAAAAAAPAAPKSVPSEKAAAAARCVRVTPAAAKYEKSMAKRMSELEASIQHILNDEALKKQRRDIEKKMTVHVQQISATLDQVAKKCVDVYQLLMSLQDPAWRTFGMLQFVIKVMRQYELIALNNKAAYPLALVLVKVSTQFPTLMEMMVALLHREVPTAVPMSVVHDEAVLTSTQYHRLMGYKEVEDKATGGKMFETTDELCKRIEGLMLLYGAIVQVDDPNNPHGIDHGWTWLSRALNVMPADRITAKALICFLRSAGYTLHIRFRGQFIKLLRCMHDEFLPELARSSDPDVAPLRTLLAHYLTRTVYLQEPEGRAMPRVDISSFFDRD